jgi:hypothetical protein
MLDRVVLAVRGGRLCGEVGFTTTSLLPGGLRHAPPQQSSEQHSGSATISGIVSRGEARDCTMCPSSDAAALRRSTGDQRVRVAATLLKLLA